MINWRMIRTLGVSVTCSLAINGCETLNSTTPGKIFITGQVESNGMPVNGGSVPSSAVGLQLVLNVKTETAGQWTLLATTDGAISLPMNAASKSINFGTQANQDISLVIPLELSGTVGDGGIHTSISGVTKDFSVNVGQNSIVLSGELQQDGAIVSAQGGQNGVSATASSLQFLAHVTGAPVGSWQMVVSADGALGTMAGIPVTKAFTTDGSSQADVAVPVLVTQPTGTGYVHARVAGVSKDFAFVVAPLRPKVTELCVQPSTGPCLGEGGAENQAGDGDGEGGDQNSGAGNPLEGACHDGIQTLPLTGVPTALQVGDRVFVHVVANGPVAGAPFICTLTATGSIAYFVNGNPVGSTTASFGYNASSVDVPAIVQSAGVGLITAAVGGGEQEQRRVVVGAEQLAVRQVRFLAYSGVAARNRVTVCTGVNSGQVSATPTSGSLDSTTATVNAPDPALCPPPYRGQASFTWLGTQAETSWSFSTHGAASVPFIVPVSMLGTGVTLLPDTIRQVWTPGDDYSIVDVWLRLARTAPEACPADSAEGSADGGAGGADAGSPKIELLSKVDVEFFPTAGATVAARSAQTDANGEIFVQLRVPNPVTELSLQLTVAHQASTSVQLK